jgi:predicted deacetylase
MTPDLTSIRSVAKYLLRFDDLCPTMNHEKWARLEHLVDRHRIKPIIAVVPDNQDSELQVCPADANFWGRMRCLQARGWTIALHGNNHICSAHGRSLVPLHRDTEFAGLPEPQQRDKIQGGLRMLRSEGLNPTVWVAPRHGFDRATVRVLLSCGIRCISDGFAKYPHSRKGVLWIPQQMWSPEPRQSGVWTICVHPNTASAERVEILELFLHRYGAQFTSVPQIESAFQNRPCTLVDSFFTILQLLKYRLRSYGNNCQESHL